MKHYGDFEFELNYDSLWSAYDNLRSKILPQIEFEEEVLGNFSLNQPGSLILPISFFKMREFHSRYDDGLYFSVDGRNGTTIYRGRLGPIASASCKRSIKRVLDELLKGEELSGSNIPILYSSDCEIHTGTSRELAKGYDDLFVSAGIRRI